MSTSMTSGDGPERDPSAADTAYIGTPLAAERARRGGRGGGEGDDGAMESRMARVEAFLETSRDDLKEIRGDMKALIGKLGTVPSKADLNMWKWQWLATSFVVFALIVGALIGGLGWLASAMR